MERENSESASPEESVQGELDQAEQKPKKSLLRKIMIGIVIALATMLLIVVALLLRLFSRISRPEQIATPAAVVEVTPTSALAPPPTIEPTTEPTPAEPTPIPLPTQEPGPLPLEEVYNQTYLTGEQLEAIENNKANTDVVNILLVGLDRRGSRGNYTNTDTIMIATLDKKNGRLKLTSMLRDLYVPIADNKPWRINSVASKNGIQSLIETVNGALRLNIENYVAVDFSMFEKIVDKLGGVTIRMSTAEISAANDNIAGLNRERGASYLWDGFIFANAGNVKCTGKQALAYARIRHLDSDFKRTNRQFSVLTAIFAKFRTKSVIDQYAIIDELLPLVETDMGGLQIIDTAISALSMNTSGLLHFTVPVDGLYKSATVSGSYVLLFDMPATAWEVHQFIYYSNEEPAEATVLSPGKSLPPRTPNPLVTPELEEGVYDETSDPPEEGGDEPVIEYVPEF